MKSATLHILQSARIAELRTSVMDTAALCEQRTPVRLPSSLAARHRRLLRLLMNERRRNAKLVELVKHG
jgi:hypothetical protein